jgi:tRNA(fMet)-specific endonuclease VapC
VTPAEKPVLLDTGVLILLCRGGAAAAQLQARYPSLNGPRTPWISVVTVGEALAFARRNGWGRAKVETLEAMLRDLVRVDIGGRGVLEAYAELDAHLTRIGRRMGQQNDLWIAATAAATGAIVLTTDRDFDVLHPGHLTREWVDPASLAV